MSQGPPGSCIPHLIGFDEVVDEAMPFTVADIQAAMERLSHLDGTTTIHGWDANGSPVDERVFLVDVHSESVLARWYREERERQAHGEHYEVVRAFDRGDPHGDETVLVVDGLNDSFMEVLLSESAMVRRGVVSACDGTIGHLRDVRIIRDEPLPRAPNNRHERRRAAALKRRAR